MPTTKPAAYVVTFAAPPLKLSPQRLRAAADTRDAARLAAALPDVVSPVAAIGIGVKAPGACPSGSRWVHAGTVEGRSRWHYCTARVTSASADIHGAHGAECRADGDLDVDADIPADVARALRAAYEAARGVVEPSKVNALVARLLSKDFGGQSVTSSVYVLPDLPDEVIATLRTLQDLGGLGASFPIGDPATIAAVAAPVLRSLEDDVAAVVARVADLAARSAACAADDGAATVHERSGETARRDLDDARERLTVWRDRLGVATHAIESALDTATTSLDVQFDAAMRALEIRRAARAAARKAGPAPMAHAAE
jgi:hypothetical protein